VDDETTICNNQLMGAKTSNKHNGKPSHDTNAHLLSVWYSFSGSDSLCEVIFPMRSDSVVKSDSL
jgi:hypothetical protein